MFLKNPIFAREFKVATTSWRSILFVLSYLAILGGLLFILWPSDGIQSVLTNSNMQLFSLFFTANLTLLILLVPAFSATSVTCEHERHTFDPLFITLLSPLDIMIGKLASSTLLLILLSLFSMPIASLCALTGGINITVMAKIVMILVAATVSYGTLGLLCSSVCRRSSTAIFLNYALILVFAGVVWLPSILLKGLVPGFASLLQAIRSISPYDALYYVLYPENYRISLGTELAFGGILLTPLLLYIVASTTLTVISIVLFYLKLRSPDKQARQKNDKMYIDTEKAVKRKLTWPFYIFDPLRRKKNIGRFSNPVFVVEMRNKLFANPKFVLRGISTIFIVSLAILTLIAFQFGTTVHSNLVRNIAVLFQIGVVAMLAPGVSSGLITDEITGGTLTAMRMTPVKPIVLIVGKLKATGFYALIFIVSSSFVIFAMAYLEHQDVWPATHHITSYEFWQELYEFAGDATWWEKLWNTYKRIVVWVIILLLTTITLLSGGLCASAFSKTTETATAFAYAIAALLCLVSFAPLILAEQLTDATSQVILAINPIAAAMQATNYSFSEFPELWVTNVYILTSLTILFISASVLRVWYLFNRQD